MLATFTSTISKEYNINIVTLLMPLSDLRCYDLNFLSNVFSLTICVVAQEGGGKNTTRHLSNGEISHHAWTKNQDSKLVILLVLFLVIQ
jgi:hypothetical protein